MKAWELFYDQNANTLRMVRKIQNSFLGLEKRNFTNKVKSKLKVGFSIITDKDKILQAQYNSYQDLYGLGFDVLHYVFVQNFPLYFCYFYPKC